MLCVYGETKKKKNIVNHEKPKLQFTQIQRNKPQNFQENVLPIKLEHFGNNSTFADVEEKEKRKRKRRKKKHTKKRKCLGIGLNCQRMS